MPPQVHQPAKSLHTLADLARALHRSAVYLHGIQARFELPAFDGDGYSTAYLELLRTLVYLRTLAVSEETLRDLWQIEKKLLQLLHADSTGSPTWFLDSCGATTHPERRLLLTNYDLGVPFTGRSLQLGLNFTEALPELFAGRDMGEDVLRVLNEYLKLHTRILDAGQSELPLLRAATKRGVALANSV